MHATHDRDVATRTGQRRPTRAWLLVMLTCAALAARASASPPEGAPPAHLAAEHASAPAASDRIARGHAYFGDAVLTDQDGNRHRFWSDLLAEDVVLVNVVFSRCPSACPLATQHLRQVRRLLGDRFGREVRFLSFSVDPDHDTPEAMKAFARAQGADEPGWRFLVADRETMAGVLGRLGQWSDDAASHSTLMIAGNARRAHWLKLRPGLPPERIVADLERLLEGG